MDEKLMAWARAVKARRRGAAAVFPPLWIFSDRERLPDPRAVLERLPRGLCGVVFRPGGVVDPGLADAVARLCRQRRFVLVVAGDWRLARRLGAGRHFSKGAVPAGARLGRLRTAPAHDRAELVRAGRLGVDAVFLSPVFPTASHPGAVGLGVVRWAGLAVRQRARVLALGGIDGGSVRRLPRFCAGVGVVGAAGRLAFSSPAR